MSLSGMTLRRFFEVHNYFFIPESNEYILGEPISNKNKNKITLEFVGCGHQKKISVSSLASFHINGLPCLQCKKEFVNVPKDIIITAFQAGSGIMNLVSPTSAIMLGVLGIAHIDYAVWLKFTAKLLVMLFLVSIAVLSLATILS